MELLQELVKDNDVEVIPLAEAINEAIRSLSMQHRGGQVKSAVKGAAGFFAKNPALTDAAGALAMDALDQYKRNKRNTIRLFAKDPYEKRMMTDIVNMMTKSGKFKLRKTKYADGGVYWELRRLGGF